MVSVNKLFVAAVLSMAVAAPADDVLHNGLVARDLVDTSSLSSAVGGLLNDILGDVEGLVNEILTGQLLKQNLATTVQDTLDEVQEIVNKLGDILDSVDLSQLGSVASPAATSQFNALKSVASQASAKAAQSPADQGRNELDDIVGKLSAILNSLVAELGKVVGKLPGDGGLGLLTLLAGLLNVLLHVV